MSKVFVAVTFQEKKPCRSGDVMGSGVLSSMDVRIGDSEALWLLTSAEGANTTV
jgi:hypothetical protein